MATGTALVLGKKDQDSNHTMSVTRIDEAGGEHTDVLRLYVSDKNSNALRADAIGPGTGAGVIAYSSSSGDEPSGLRSTSALRGSADPSVAPVSRFPAVLYPAWQPDRVDCTGDGPLSGVLGYDRYGPISAARGHAPQPG